MVIRPPSLLTDILDGLADVALTVIGALGTEERSQYVPEVFLAHNNRGIVLLEVLDPPTSPFAKDAAAIRNERWTRFSGSVGVSRVQVPLLAHPTQVLSKVREICAGAHGRVVLDITSLPKKFFFVLLRECLASAAVTDLVICYAAAKAYPQQTKRLSWDCQEISPLPTFGSTQDISRPTRVVVASGFQLLGLDNILSSGPVKGVQIDVIVPVPARGRQLAAIADFVAAVEATNAARQLRVKPIGAESLWAAYNLVVESNSSMVWLLPYGPKPISTAMALAAIRKDWPVFYTQPRVYRPDYSTGVIPERCFAYPVRVGGRDLF